MPTLRNDKTYTNAVVPSGPTFKRGSVTPEIIQAPKKLRRSQRNLGESPSPAESPVEVLHNKKAHDPASRSALTCRPRGKIRCLAFGKYRRILYPSYFWCSHCDYWEQYGCLMGGKANMESRNFACQAKHTSIISPTHVASAYQPSKQLYDVVLPTKELLLSKRRKDIPVHCDLWDDTDDDDTINDNLKVAVDDDCYNSPPAMAQPAQQQTNHEKNDEQDIAQDQQQKVSQSTLPFIGTPPVVDHHPPLRDPSQTVSLTRTIYILQDSVKVAHIEIERLHNINNQLNCKYESTKSKLSRLQQQHDAEVAAKSNLASSLQAAAIRLGLRGASLVQEIADAAFSVFGGRAKDELLKRSKKILHETIFSPFNIARLMDLTGGILNLSCIELLRSLETKGKSYQRDTLLPSSSSIQKVFRAVEQIGNVRAPFHILSCRTGEAIVFDYKKVLCEVLRAYKLEEVGKTRPIRLAQSVDGSNLTKYINHTMGGIKINDPAAIEPGTNALMFATARGKDEVVSSTQSRNHCFPLQIHIGQEDKEMYLHFKPMFQFLNSCSEHSLNNYYKPMKVTTEADLSATWKMTGRGGGAKTCLNPCHCCGIKSNDLHRESTTRCERWCHGKPDGWVCYHKSIVTDEVLEGMKAEVSKLQEALGDIINKVQDSQLTFEDPVNITGSAVDDPNSIHYQPATLHERQLYSCLINAELTLRDKSACGRLTERVTRLRELLTIEHHHQRVAEEVQACERPNQALFMLMQCIPCVLHMENRLGLKFLQMVLISGLSGVKESQMFLDIPGGETAKTLAMMKTVEKIMNEKILGSVDCPSQWRFPYDEKEKKLKPLSFANYKTRKIINKIELLVECLVPEGEKMQKWLRCMPRYREAMELLRQKTDLTDEEIGRCQNAIDLWFKDWVSLSGLDGMTNYVHLLSSGHIAEYMLQHRNLYRHSQQGWEAFNALLKSFFFRRTGRGGGRSGTKSKLKPIARWLQRRVLWLCGLNVLDLEVSVQMLTDKVEDIILEQDNTEGNLEELEHLGNMQLALNHVSV